MRHVAPARLATAVPALAACAALAPCASAQASTVGVKTSIETQTKAVINSSAARKLESARATNSGQARKLVGPLEAFARKLDQAATAVSRSRATNSTQRTARTDWVKGVRGDATAIDQIVTAFKDVERGDKTAATRELLTAKKTALAGAKLVKRADTSLGIALPS